MDTRKWMRGWVPALALTVVAAGCGAEEEVGVQEELDAPVAEAPAVGTAGYAEYDLDRDNRLAMNEFGGWATRAGTYNRWNTTADAGLDEREFGTGMFGLWDRDRGGTLDEAEWTEGVGSMFGEGESYGTFADWDLNRDNALDDNELGQGFNRTGLYGRWDRDRNNMIGENEYNEGWFGLFDRNRDTFLDENEYNEGIGRWGEGLGMGV